MENNSASPTSRASVTGFAPNAFNPWYSLLVLLGAVVLLFSVVIAGAVVWYVKHGFDIVALERTLAGFYGVEIQSVAEIFVVLYFLLVLPPLGGRSLRDLGFRALSGRDVSRIALAIAVMFVLVTALGSFFENVLHIKTPEAAVKMFITLRGTPKVLFAVFAIVVGPVTEEFFFRIFMFNATNKWWGFWPAAITSSILFGAAHAQPGGAALFVSLAVPLAAGGIVLCTVYDRTRNAWSNIITHGCFNGLSLLLILVAPQLAK